jgi:serine/threonine protein kinase
VSAGPPEPDERTVVGAAASLNGGAALPVGHALQEYVIEGLVGEGGFGIVYLARDTRLGRVVALKEYMPSNLATRGADQTVSVRSERHRETFELGLRSFVNEAQLLASFDHPSLVKVYRFWEANGTAYMVMPFYQGPTLKKWLRDLGHPPDERWLLALLAPMIDALEQLHNDHCYHRDIAPDNILLLPLQGTQAGSGATTVRPLLLDFGAARRVIGDMTHALTVILKPGYAPIEQYADSAAMKQGPWTDVYALSAVLYTCVTGRAPVPSVSRIITDDMVPAAQAGAGRYTPMFLEAIDAGLSVRPDTRPQSMLALRELFAATSHGEMSVMPLVTPGASLARATTAGTVAPTATAQTTAPPAKAAARIEPVMAADPSLDKTVIAPREARGEVPPRPSTPPAQSSSRPLRLAFAALAVLLVASGTWWWLGAKGGKQGAQATAQAPTAIAAPGAAPSAAATAATAAPPPPGLTAAPPPAPAAAPTALPPVDFSVLAALQDIVARSNPQLTVAATADKNTLVIGRDLLKFRVKASEGGYLYVFHGGTDKGHFNLLFPNQLDKKNRIEGGRDVVLPRSNWEITAGGPPGTTHIVALVSRHERNFAQAGMLATAEAIPEFDLEAARQRWAQRAAAGAGASPFVGTAVCDAAPCDEAYGATMIEINEVAAPARPRK